MKSNILTMIEQAEVEWKPLGDIFEIIAGGDVPKDALSIEKTDEFCIPILSNGIGKKALYGWTNQAKINKPSLTISARGTIGWTSYRENPFFPIVRLLVLTPKVSINLKFAYYFMKMIENDYKVPESGIPQLTKPMIKDILIPIPPLELQKEIVKRLDILTELEATLEAELSLRKKQYHYYRDFLLSENELVKVGFEWKSLGEVGELIRGNGLTKKDLLDDGVPAIHYGQIYTHFDTFADKTKSFTSPEVAKKLRKAQYGDVLIAGTSENVQDVMKPVGWFGDEIVFSGDMFAFRPNEKIMTKYLTYMLQTTAFAKFKEKCAQGTKVIRVKTDSFLNYQIPIPPLKTQAKIVAILDKFDRLTSSITDGLPKEIELRRKQYEYYRELLLGFENDTKI